MLTLDKIRALDLVEHAQATGIALSALVVDCFYGLAPGVRKGAACRLECQPRNLVLSPVLTGYR